MVVIFLLWVPGAPSAAGQRASLKKSEIKQYLVELPDMKEMAIQEYCFGLGRGPTFFFQHFASI